MILLILVIALLLRLWNLNQSLWLDEAAQAIESGHGIITILRNMPADFHPPLFHILMHFWLIIGTEEWKMRLLPVVFGLASILVTYLLTKDLFSKRTAVLAALLLAVNPFHIYYSQELRPYMASLFFMVLSAYFFWKSLKITGNSLKMWAAFTVVTALSLYTSYFTVFLIISQFVFLVFSRSFHKKIGGFLISVSLAGGLFLPWLPQIPLQLRISHSLALDLPEWKDAVASPVYKAIPLTLVKFIIGQINFRPLYLYGLIAILTASLWAWTILRYRNFSDTSWRYLFIVLSVALTLPVLLSLYLQVASPKRLIYVLPIIIILLACGLTRLKGYYFKIVFALLLIINISGILIYQTNPLFQREDWRGATAKVESLSTDRSVNLFKFSEPFAPFTWYAKDTSRSFGLNERLAVGDMLLGAKLNSLTRDADKVFLFQYLEGLTDQKRIADKVLEGLGFIKIQTFDYPGVGLIYEYSR